MVLVLAIPVDLPTITKVQHMAAGVRMAQEATAKAQGELTLHIA